MEEIAAMRGRLSPSTGRRYPLTMVCGVLRMPRSSVYATAAPLPRPDLTGKRGPKTVHTDTDLVTAIRVILAVSPFHGEGYRKAAPSSRIGRSPRAASHVPGSARRASPHPAVHAPHQRESRALHSDGIAGTGYVRPYYTSAERGEDPVWLA